MKRAVLPLFLILSVITSLLPTRASAQTIPNWAVGVSYSVGSLVMYQGVEYDALQANVSEVGWDPISAPALWQKVSGGSSCTTIPNTPTGLDWELATNDASPIYDDAADPLNGTGNTIDATVNYYLAKGVPAYKYTMGFPAYGAGWTGGLNNTNCGEYQNATQVSPVPNANGVGVCSTGNNQSSPTAGCDPILTNGLATYATIKNLLSNGYTACYDSTRIATSAFNTTAQTVFSYDDATSIAAKATYIKAHGLGGGYVWAVKDDDANGTIVKALAADLNP